MIYTFVQQRLGTPFRQVTPPYRYMKTPANTAKLGTMRSNIQTAQPTVPTQVRSWVGTNLQCIGQHTSEPAH